MLRRARKTNKQEDWSHYSNAKCGTASIIKRSKRSFFCEQIDENKGDPKGFWKARKNLSGSGKRTTKIVEVETENGTVYHESSVANELNEFFTKILEQLGKDDHSSDSVFDDSKLKKFISSRLSPTRSFVIPEIKSQQVADIISKISVNKATGYDGSSAKTLKLIHALCRLLNLSIATNTFPDKWKVGQVAPLHKGGQQRERNNYGPITVLPILSKIIEKHVANSLLKYLQENNLLYELQSAFRSGHSTETALIRVTDEILFKMDNDELTGLVFVNQSQSTTKEIISVWCQPR